MNLPIIELTTRIGCSVEIAFDLARSIDLHEESTSQTKERAIAGRTSGLIEMGESVTWEATHFGRRQRLTSKITAFDRPHYFRDSMVEGAFRSFDHDHYFAGEDGGTLMRDRFDFVSPFGLLGRVADFLVLERYMRRLLERRNLLIKRVAESDPKRYVWPDG